MLMISGVFNLFVLVGPLADLIDFCLLFSSVGCIVLNSSLLKLVLGPSGMLYYCKWMSCAGPPFEVIIISDDIGAGG